MITFSLNGEVIYSLRGSQMSPVKGDSVSLNGTAYKVKEVHHYVDWWDNPATVDTTLVTSRDDSVIELE